MLFPTQALLSLLLPAVVQGWGSGNGNTDTSAYGDTFTRDWLYDATAISLRLEGCVWSYVSDNEDVGCMEDSSEDGTTYWYQMANCRRANAAFSIFATESSGSAGCNSNTYKESFLSTGGLSEFIYYLASYDPNSPFGDDDGDNDGNDGWSYDELPLCEEGDNGYIGLGCADDGTFTIDYFNDAYCLSRAGTYDTLDNLNYKLKQYRNCAGVYTSGDDYNVAQYLIPYSSSCSSLDSSLCADNSAMSSRMSSSSSSNRVSRAVRSSGHKSWVTKLKYATAGLLLLASFVLFTGILFTNRRRRRALMKRRARQARRREEKSRRSSKSGRSKSRDGKGRSSSSGKKRSKSRPREEAEEGEGGVYT